MSESRGRAKGQGPRRTRSTGASDTRTRKDLTSSARPGLGKSADKMTEVPRLNLDMTPFKDAKLPIIWVLGGPGSGKGTQCVKIVEKFGYTHISSGDLLRAEVASGSELGKSCEAIMKSGSLVPTGVIMDLMKKAILEAVATSKGYLIDGLPRELGQAKIFEEEISTCALVLNFEVSDETLKARLLERGKGSGRVDDQNLDTILARIETFHNISEPVIKQYASLCKTINAERPVDEVFADVETILKALA